MHAYMRAVSTQRADVAVIVQRLCIFQTESVSQDERSRCSVFISAVQR